MKPRIVYLCCVLLLAFGWVHPAVGDNYKNPLRPWYLSDKVRGWYFDGLLGVGYEPTYAVSRFGIRRGA